jgi:outer membrane protein assembly factor BamB
MTRSPRFAALALTMAIASLALVCKKLSAGGQPATPASPLGVSTGRFGATYAFTALSTDPDSDRVAIRFSWGDSVTSDWSSLVASGVAVSQTHSWSSPGSYEVSAQAKDVTGLLSDWSAPLTVTVTSNNAPGTPTIPTGPTSVRKDSLCEYTGTAIDPDSDDVSYRFAWGNGDTSIWTQDWTHGGTPDSVEYAYLRAGTFQVRVQARDGSNALSGWSDPLTVTIINPYPPVTPRTPFGENEGGRGQVLGFTSEASDPGGDSVSIRFSWGDGDTSEWSYLLPRGRWETMEHAWSDTSTYFIRAQARDEDGALSDWSAACSLSITRRRWRLGTGTEIHSSPAVGADGTVYIGTDWGSFYALTPDGSVKWCYECDGNVRTSPAVGTDGTTYFGTDAYFYALDPSGALKWRYFIPCVSASAAVGTDGTIYVGSQDHALYAFKPDGTLKWRLATGNAICSSPAIAADGTIYVGSCDRYLHAINPDGTLRWRYLTGDNIWSSPAIAADGTVYVGSSDQYLYAINPDSTLKWRYQTGGPIFESSPAVAADGTVYVGSDDHFLYAIDPDGTLKWRYQTDGRILSSPAVTADGTVYIGSHDCTLYALDPNGALRWKYRTSYWFDESSPALAADGTVYVGTFDYVYAIEGGSPLADSPWPKFHHDNRNSGRVDGP